MVHDDPRPREMDALLALAARHGVTAREPVVLRERSNLLVHLAPAPVVARIPNLVLAVRTEPERYLRVDLQLAGYLHAAGAPVVAPSAELPPGPHRIGDRWCAFWTYEPHEPERVTDHAWLRACLAEMHELLAAYPGELGDGHGPLADLRLGLERMPWNDTESALLSKKIDALESEITALPAQPLHGDAHTGNVLCTPNGPLWTDFEDAWHGPVEWDIACLADSRVPVPPLERSPAFELCKRLRDLHGKLWCQVLRPGDYAATARERMLAP